MSQCNFFNDFVYKDQKFVIKSIKVPVATYRQVSCWVGSTVPKLYDHLGCVHCPVRDQGQLVKVNTS